MDLVTIDDMNAEQAMSKETLVQIFDASDDLLDRQEMLNHLRQRVSDLHLQLKPFDNLVKAFYDQIKIVEAENKKAEVEKRKNDTTECLGNQTAFDYFGDGREFNCGNWFANYQGIRTFGPMGTEIIASHHPILIKARLIDAEKSEEQVTIAYYADKSWKEMTVDKLVIVSNTRIVQLAKYGVDVTTETAKALVRYLSEFENLNQDMIVFTSSSSKLGWIQHSFVPYDNEIEFGQKSRFKSLIESITECGDYEKWLKLALEVRKTGRIEPQVYMAGSFASVLLSVLDDLPFILDIWGETGTGKTVALMLAVSIWASPEEGKYLIDSSATPTVLEVRQNVLNHLPLALDDLSKMREKYADDFATLVYHLCAGKGKERSNIDLGINDALTWKNVILTNMERPLSADNMKGGAINRIIDIRSDSGKIFADGNSAVRTLKKNYGFAGKIFVQAVKDLGKDKLIEMQQDYAEKIRAYAKQQGVEKEEKQIIPLSVLFTADKLATDTIFHDGIYLDFNRLFNDLKDVGAVSENKRAYEYIMSEVGVRMNNFQADDQGNYKGEIWGKIADDCVYILMNAYKRMAKEGNFSAEGFKLWANDNGLLIHDKNHVTKLVKINGNVARSICVKKDNGEDIPTNGSTEGFREVKEDEEIELPFDAE